ncbi:tetratricopeptide repeat protein [Planctomycetota bacterium]
MKDIGLSGTFFLCVSLLLTCGCQNHKGPKPEAISLLGRSLFSDTDGGDLLAAIDKELEPDPDNSALLLRKGLALEDLRRFNEAVAIYSYCLSQDPENVLMLRRRGHRYINLRRLAEAVADLEKAALLHEFQKVENLGYEDNLNWAIWYYLGLAHYLQGDFDIALTAFQNSYTYSADNTSLLASTNWVHNILRRLNRIEEAQKILEPIKEDMGFAGNYYKNILLYKGLRTESEVFDEANAQLFELATVGYGVANWRLVNGDKEGAYRLFRKIVEGESWQANGFMAAEAELARIK